jgi:hypothetical protein
MKTINEQQEDIDLGRVPPDLGCKQQKWTPERLIAYLDTKSKDGSFKERMQLIANDFNAALTAEHQRREQAERDYKICCTMRDNHSKQLEVVLPIRMKLQQQLLSALAAIEENNKLADDFDEGRWKINSVDLSLLHEHVRKEQKPLVDALRKIAALPLSCTCGRIAADALAKVKQ